MPAAEARRHRVEVDCRLLRVTPKDPDVSVLHEIALNTL